jgi:hypothetical protein
MTQALTVLALWVSRQQSSSREGGWSCGAVAHCIETACREVTHEDADADTLLRVHVQVDADNGCFDHVCFLLPQHRCIVDAYVGLTGPRMYMCPGGGRCSAGWLQRVRALGTLGTGGSVSAVRLTARWRHLFAVPWAPAFRGPIAAVHVHESYWRLPQALPLAPPLHKSPRSAAGPSAVSRLSSEADLDCT